MLRFVAHAAGFRPDSRLPDRGYLRCEIFWGDRGGDVKSALRVGITGAA
jgi:hypothetical protein